MKRSVIAIIISLSVSLQVLAKETLSYLFEQDYSLLTVDLAQHSSGEQFCKLSIPGFISDAEEWDPILPAKQLLFEVPPFVNNFKVTIKSYELESSRQLIHPIIPLERLTNNEAIDGVSKGLKFGRGYSNTFIAPSAEVINDFFVDGDRHFVGVRICPFSYEHSNLDVSIFNKIKIELTYDECTASELKFKPVSPQKNHESCVISSDMIAASSSRLSKSPQKNIEDSVIQNYLILVPQNLKDGVRRFANWKRQKGYAVLVQTVENILNDNEYAIGSNAECFDKESSIREWLKDYYEKNGIFYCLIVGDFRTSAPIRKFKSQFGIHFNSEHTIDWTNPDIEEYVPSDLYFCDLTSDWDFYICDAGIYISNVEDFTFSPDVLVGRLPCHTYQEIQNFTDKVILYESKPGRGNPSYLTTGLKVKFQTMKTFSTVLDSLLSPRRIFL